MSLTKVNFKNLLPFAGGSHSRVALPIIKHISVCQPSFLRGTQG